MSGSADGENLPQRLHESGRRAALTSVSDKLEPPEGFDSWYAWIQDPDAVHPLQLTKEQLALRLAWLKMTVQLKPEVDLGSNRWD